MTTSKQSQGKRNKEKGREFERDVVIELASQGFSPIRLSYAGAPKDLGDIGGLGIRIECKNLKSLAEGISEGISQARLTEEPYLVIVKRRGRGTTQAVVAFELKDLSKIIQWAKKLAV